MKKTLFAVIIPLIILSGCAPIKLSVNKVDDTKGTKPYETKTGFFYYLPQNKYNVQVTYRKATIQPTSLYESADAKCQAKINTFFSNNKSYKAPGSYYEILDAQLISQAIIDKEKHYFVELKNAKKPLNNNKLAFNFEASGLTTGGSISSVNTGPALGIQIGTAIVNVVIGFFGGTPIDIPDTKQEEAAELKALVKNGPCTQIQEIMEAINKVRESRIDSLTCNKCYTTNNDIATVLVKLDKREAELTAYLVNIKPTYDTLTVIYEYKPVEGETKVFGFTEKSGPTKVESEMNAIATGKGNVFTIDLSHAADNSFYATPMALDSKKHGFVYNLPAPCLLKMYDAKAVPGKSKEITKTEIIPQLGTVAYLPAKLGCLKNVQSFTIDSKTGALTQYGTESSAFDKSALDPALELLKTLPGDIDKLSPLSQEMRKLEAEKAYYELLKAKQDALNSVPK